LILLLPYISRFVDTLTRKFERPKVRPHEEELPRSSARESDPWFWTHYEGAATIVRSLVPDIYLGAGKKVMDFGCGDGATTLGVASHVAAEVVGVDLHTAFMRLPDLTQANLGTASLPENLSFRQTRLAEPLPFFDESFDLVYSWSVFEHLADIQGTLAEFHRVTREGAAIFIQIEPLFYGPFGSHLQRLVDEPWAHLLYQEEEFLGMAASAVDQVSEAEKDTLYRTNEFEDTKRYLLGEYNALNRTTSEELLSKVRGAGFNVQWHKIIKAEGLDPPPELLTRFPSDLLLTNQIVIFATRR
jgi:ubiquinone/menaquinone biosynthesis C-methylase UbiE